VLLLLLLLDFSEVEGFFRFVPDSFVISAALSSPFLEDLSGVLYVVLSVEVDASAESKFLF